MIKDRDEQRVSRGGRGGFFFPWRRVKGLDPRSVVRSRIGGQKDIGSSYGFALSALRKRRSSSCPKCGNEQSVSVLEAITGETGGTTYVLGCKNCDYVENVEITLEGVAKTIDSLRIGERRFLIAAALAAAFGFAYYFVTGYLFTLIGAILIAALILLNALTFRYRVWQLVHGRLYEAKPPMGDWLRHEFSKGEDADQLQISRD
ncbi:MAG: hypothetical protein ORO03_04500 [Alphaproteobacteria bacterium]|nr:hypothetical protein [Alphaproteobacteria bacterium]